MSLFCLSGVRQVFDGRTVLDIEQLELSPGTSYALQGPNGSGKTTLLQVLAFLKKPTSGQIRFKGELVDWQEKTLCSLRRRVSLIDQHPIMFTASVRKNVEYGLRMRGVASRRRRRLAEESLELVGLIDLADRSAHRLSGGETQRVAIARALACAPEILLFDEPTANVDVENQARIEAVIHDICTRNGITVIFSTHKELEAIRLADRRIYLYDGRVAGMSGENILSGIISIKGGRTVCTVGPSFEFPVSSARPGAARIAIDPKRIRIVSLERYEKQEDTVLSFCRCTGVVQEMRFDNNMIRALVDAAVPLEVLLTREEVAFQNLVVGDTVAIEVDHQAIQIMQ